MRLIRFTKFFLSLAKLPILFKLARPIQADNARADVAMKRRVRPIAHPCHQTVLEWVDVTIFDVAGVVGFVADQVLPETPLPDSPFVACGPNSVKPFLFRQYLRKATFHDPPTRREVRVARRQGPDCVEMIWQHDEGVDGARKAMQRFGDCLTQRLNMID